MQNGLDKKGPTETKPNTFISAFSLTPAHSILLTNCNIEDKMGENPKSVQFSNGNTMPIIGLGTLGANGEELKEAVKIALNCGYQLIDTAYMHGNEVEIGSVVRDFLEARKIKRDDLFIISKVSNYILQNTGLIFF